jgi:hypothetical protein
MTAKNATLVVIEFGANWPRWLSPIDSGDMAVVAQYYEGPADSLLVQVRSRVSRVVAVGWRIDDVILVSNGHTDLEAMSARSLLARELLGHLREVGGVRLLLTVDEVHGRRASHTLTALGASLQNSALSNGIALCVRIGDRAPIYARPPAPRVARAG